MTPIINNLIIIIALAIVLIRAAKLAINELNQLTKMLKLQSYGVAMILGAISTSMPEFFVSINAALQQNNQLSLGNVMGSNIANISLTLGLAALVGGTARSNDNLINHDLIYAFLTSILASLLLLDGSLSQLDGIVLCAVYFIFILKELSKPKPKLEKNSYQIDFLDFPHVLSKWAHAKAFRHLLIFFASVFIMIIAAKFLTLSAIALSTVAHVPLFLIGLIVISLGTTLPELAFNIESIRNRQMSLLFGNIMGSLAVNSTLIIGLSAIIHPFSINNEYHTAYLISLIGYILIFGLFWNFVRTKHRLDRLEGGVLILIYLFFTAIQYLIK